MLFVVTCSFSLLKRDNSRSLRVLQPASPTCQSQIRLHTKIPSIASVKKKLEKTLKNFISWKLVIQLLVNQSLKDLQISRFSKMVTSLFWCKIAQNTESFSSLQNSASSTCMRFQQLVFCTDKESQINFALYQLEMQTQMEWLLLTEQDKFSQSMLRKTILFHTLIPLHILLITRICHSSWLKDSTCPEQMTSLWWCSTKN